MRTLILLILAQVVLFSSQASAKVKCLDVEGEAAVVNNDIPSAKAEAIGRAKWTAVEQAVGLEVKSNSMVQDMMLVDEAVSKQVSGVVSSFKVLQVRNVTDTVSARVNVCVEPSRARDAMSGLARNTSVAVFIPARKPKVLSEYGSMSSYHGRSYEYHDVHITDQHDEANMVTEAVIGKLTEHGYNVPDIAPTDAMDAAEIERLMKSGNYLSLRSLMYKFLTNIIVIGKIDYSVSTKKGEDAGLGIAMPFNHVTVRLTYRLISRDASGKIVVLTAGTENGKGLANNLEDAAEDGLRDLAEKVVPAILDKVAKHVKGVSRKIEVKVEGVTAPSDNFAVKEILQNTSWVTEVREHGLGEFLVDYPENPLYLANSLCRKGGLKLVAFSPGVLAFRYANK